MPTIGSTITYDKKTEAAGDLNALAYTAYNTMWNKDTTSTNVDGTTAAHWDTLVTFESANGVKTVSHYPASYGPTTTCTTRWMARLAWVGSLI